MRETPEDRFRLPEITKQRRTKKLKQRLEKAHPINKKKRGIPKVLVLALLLGIGYLLHHHGLAVFSLR